MRAALYARVSTEDQREASIDDQLRKCAELCKREGLRVVAKFSDFGISGNEVNRPDYQALLTAARDDEFDVIVADEVSRLWRNGGEQAHRVEELQFLGRHVLTGDGIDTRHEGFEMLLAIKGAMSTGETKRTAARVHRALEGLARQGKNAGGRAYGYKPVPLYDESKTDAYGRPLMMGARREIVPEQAAIIREVFKLYVAGWSARTIADELNRRGIPSPGASWRRKERRTDGKWLASTIAGDPKRGIGILNNELYIGRCVWNRIRTKKRPNSRMRKQFLRPASERIIVAAPKLRIVSQDLWDRVKVRQRERAEKIGTFVRNGLATAKSRAFGGAGQAPRYAFSGLLQCAVCGANYTVSGARQSYICGSHTNGGKHACANRLRVPRRIVEARLLEGIQRDLLSPENLRETIEAWQRTERRLLRERRAANATKRTVDDAKLGKLRTERANLIEAIATVGLKGNAGLAERLARTETELAEVERRAGVDDVDQGKIADMLPRVSERLHKVVADLGNVLHRDAGRARATLKELLGGPVRLKPAENGRHLVALIGLGQGAVVKSLNYKRTISMVAGVGFEPTTFGL